MKNARLIAPRQSQGLRRQRSRIGRGKIVAADHTGNEPQQSEAHMRDGGIREHALHVRLCQRDEVSKGHRCGGKDRDDRHPDARHRQQRNKEELDHEGEGADLQVVKAGILRTCRPIMKGEVFIPEA